MSLKYSQDHLYSPAVNFGITPTTLAAHETKINQVLTKVEQDISESQPAFIRVLGEERLIRQVKQVYASLRWAKTMVVIGIGGSDLGGRAIKEALDEDLGGMDILFTGDSTDPVAIDRLLKVIDLDETVFVIVSKSGGTLETMAQYFYFVQLLKLKTDDWAEHFVCVTDPSSGLLRQEAIRHEMLTVDIPSDIGGRFSVLSGVGLLPALAMGVDIDQMLAGAKLAATNSTETAKAIAKDQFLLLQQGIQVNICMAYSIQLQEFTRWYRQLWAESLGKKETGILPVSAWGPADQHSQLQFYTQGSLLHSVLFLTTEGRDNADHLLEKIDLPEFSHLNGRYFGELLSIEQSATASALTDVGRPHATLSLGRIDAHTLGELFVLFELAVVYLAGLLDVNPYDQPGVESSKQHMNRLLKVS